MKVKQHLINLMHLHKSYAGSAINSLSNKIESRWKRIIEFLGLLFWCKAKMNSRECWQEILMNEIEVVICGLIPSTITKHIIKKWFHNEIQ